MSIHFEGSVGEETDEFAEDPKPRELESALLSIVLFGALLAFGVGCVLIGWS